MKLNKIICGILCMVALNSCSDKMEYHEYNNYDSDFVKLNFNNVGGLITNIYLFMDTDFGNYNGALLSSATDESQYAYSGNQIEDFYNDAWSPTNAKSSMWSSCYEGIANCNLYLDEFMGLTFPELALNADYAQQMFRYNNYQYEVRFLRAYFYFNLVRQYGDVPFTDHVLTVGESNTLTRRPAQEILDYIISECDDIKEKIIADYASLGDMQLAPAETGRANRRTVLALKARTTLYAASSLFNPSEDKELWYRAASANKELIDDCDAAKMKLVSDYSTLWSKDSYNDAVSELIFGRRANRTTNSLEAYNFPVGLEGCKGGNCPTQTLVDAYEMKATGLRPDEMSDYDPNKPYYEGRDPRFYLTIAKNGDEKWPNWNTTPLQTYQGGLNAEPLSGGTPTSYYLKKYCQTAIDLRSGTTTSFYHTWITFRLGEFYLNYAEALFKYLGDPYITTNEFNKLSAVDAMDKVRVRAGMPKIPNGLSPEEFWKKYQNERMVELAFEGHRFWDVRRWKEADKYFKSIDEMKITKKTDDTYTYTRVTVNRQWNDKMYLFPIPQSERMKNTNLTQNQGW